jgi:chromosome segregation ATPase
MPRSANAMMLDADEPALRFEEVNRAPATSSLHLNSIRHEPSSDNDPYTSLKRKQEELLKIRQQLEKTERETNQLETLRRKEERFDTGRREMTETLSRSLVRLERDLYNAQKAIEEITTARDTYQRHLDVLRSLQPEAWQRGNLDAELDRAIGAIEDAEGEYGKVSRRLASVLPEEAAAVSAERSSVAGGVLPQNFVAWMRCGLAFTLPLIAALIFFSLVSRFTH